ncbi:ABC transporter substrate-binding protein [Peribacillus kribbensis]|uniref:ABC transporter substrate-binding protein n=1 Tax=Peribacillus kribbensis TaxID=356658 RepID=UPI000412EAD6|nr:ABC transporter substrate-binding protein [Peribacillus kribbensis]
MKSPRKYIPLLAALFCSMMLLAACGNKEDSGKSSDSPKEKTVTDAMGKVTIPATPKRILAPYMEDSLTALGIKPAAQWSIGTTVLDYLQTDLKNVPKISWDLPLEQTIKAKPDLIIFSSAGAIQNGQYEEYKKIAPVYVFKDTDGADWKKQLTTIGSLTGKEKEAKGKLAEYDTKTDKSSAAIKKAIGDDTAAIIWVAGNKYYLFENNRFAGNVLYHELGVSQPDMIKKLPEAKAAWQPVSLESLSDLDADHLFITALPNEAGVAKLQESTIYKNLPAVKQNHVYIMKDPSNWTINGLLANEKTMDEIEQSLTK